MIEEFEVVGGNVDEIDLQFLKTRIEKMSNQMPAVHVLTEEEVAKQSEEMQKYFANWIKNQVLIYWNAMLGAGYSDEEAIKKLEDMGFVCEDGK